MHRSSSSLTVVCPVFNEEEGIRAFFERTSIALEGITPTVDWRILFVDDGSIDRSAEILRELAAENARVSVLSFSRNFGHQIAITAGTDHATGDAVVVIDSDLQDPPEVIADMVKLWREGNDVVYGKRMSRAGESTFKRATAAAFYRVLNRLSDVEMPLDVGDFRLMDRQVVDALKQVREGNRYMRGLVTWVGFRQCACPYQRDERFAGETKYPLRKMLTFAADGIASFSTKPLRLATQLGAFVTIGSFLWATGILLSKLANPESALPGFASLMVVTLFLGGVQLLSVGLVGQYLGRTYSESKRRPLYFVAETLNVESLDLADSTRHTSSGSHVS